MTDVPRAAQRGLKAAGATFLQSHINERAPMTVNPLGGKYGPVEIPAGWLVVFYEWNGLRDALVVNVNGLGEDDIARSVEAAINAKWAVTT